MTLEDVYNGKMANLKNRRTALCSDCHGKGGEGVKTCGECRGQGAVFKTVMMGPGTYGKMQTTCGDCRGQGEIIDPKKVCKVCKGEKVKQETKTVEIAIDVGCPEEHVIKMNGQGNEIPDAEAGDLMVKINIKKHSVYKREGADLFMEKKITLKQALLGFTFPVKTLDSSSFTVSSTKGEIISSGMVMTIKNKGMPFYQDTMSHGHLFIKFTVVFPKPEELNEEAMTALNKLLPGPSTCPAGKGEEVEYLDDYSEADKNPNADGGRGRRHEDEEEGPQHRGTECQMQ